MRKRSPAAAAVFHPVQAVTTFEETVERLGTGIRLGLLPPGSQLPPERDLADQMGISRSTLRQALTALTQSGHLVAVRGRGGGRFVADSLQLPRSSRVDLEEERWRGLLDFRVAVEVGAVVLAAERAGPADVERLRQHVSGMQEVDDFAAYRQADVFFHLGMAEAARSPRLLAAMTEVQGGMSELIGHIPHPPEVLAQSNAQHGQLVTMVERGEAGKAAQCVREHLVGTERILSGLMA